MGVRSVAPLLDILAQTSQSGHGLDIAGYAAGGGFLAWMVKNIVPIVQQLRGGAASVPINPHGLSAERAEMMHRDVMAGQRDLAEAMRDNTNAVRDMIAAFLRRA